MFRRFGKFGARKPTESAVTIKNTRSDLPTAPAEERTVAEAIKVPSYAHADRQKGAVDVTAEAKDKEDTSIVKDEGGSGQPEQPKTTLDKGKGTANKGETHSGPSTTSTVQRTNLFSRYWKLELDTDLEETVDSVTNYWTPNALAMFEILQASGNFAYANATMIKRHTDYLDYAVACYYSIIFYIQILRAQHAAGKLSGQDRSFFNRFKDRFKFEELPVSSIMFPYFSTIVSTLPMDQKYDWIVPQYATSLFKANWSGIYDISDGAAYIQPMVPYMLRILRTSITSNAITAMQATPADHFNDKDQYIFHAIAARGAAATEIFGVDFNQDTAQGADDRNVLFSLCGVRYPFEADLSTLSTAAPKWRKSKFRTFEYGVVPNTGPDTLSIDNNTAVNPAVPNARKTTKGSLDDFLHMEKSAEVDWFFELINQAATNARFFGDSKSLAEVPVTSGNEPLIGCKFRKVTRGAHVADTTVRLGLRARIANQPSWYPETFNGYVGSFYTSRAGVSREETLQAMTFGTQGSINVTYGGAALTDHRVGAGDRFLVGPYWDNKEWAATRYKELNNSNVGKAMFKGWNTMFQADAAQEKPTGY